MSLRGGFGKREQPLRTHKPLKSDPEKTRRWQQKSGTELPRTGLKAVPAMRSSGAKPKTPQQQRRQVQLATWADVLEQMYPRDDHQCAGCGTREDLNGHHREPKQMGSTKTLDLIENALTLCQWRCHPWAHKWRNSKAIALGYCVPKGGDHSEFPVTWFDGSLWRLTPDGGRVAA